MKLEYIVEDINIKNDTLIAIMYCNPFFNFNNKFINKFYIKIKEDLVQIDIINNSVVEKTLIAKFKFRIPDQYGINIATKFKYLLLQNINFEPDEYITKQLVEKLIRHSNQIIFELKKWHQDLIELLTENYIHGPESEKERLNNKKQTDINTQIEILSMDNEGQAGFSNCSFCFPLENVLINGHKYHICELHIMPFINTMSTEIIKEESLLLSFRLINTDTFNINPELNINPVMMDEDSSVIELYVAEPEEPVTAFFDIIIPIRKAAKLIFSKKYKFIDEKIHELIMNQYMKCFFDEALMTQRSYISDYVYNYNQVAQFLIEYNFEICDYLFVFFLLISTNDWFNRENLTRIVMDKDIY